MRALLGKISRIVRKVIVPGAAGLGLLLTAAHFIWMYSGSNQWRLVRDENGIQIFTLKAPGSTLIKCKARTRVKTSLSSAVFLFRGDESTYKDFGPDLKVIERIETPDVYVAYLAFTQKMPPPFRPTEMVVLLNYAQNRQTKAVEINVQAAPTKTPPTPGVSRVTHLNNLFRLTPVSNGEIEWEVDGDVDMGLFYPMANLALPEYLFKDLSRLKKLVLTEKYQKARLISVQEPPAV